MLLQIPYSLDELVATGQFLWRRKQAGHGLMRLFFIGDTDDGETEVVEDDFEQRPGGSSSTIRAVMEGSLMTGWAERQRDAHFGAAVATAGDGETLLFAE
jgi:hypothetical protein